MRDDAIGKRRVYDGDVEKTVTLTVGLTQRF